jgi:hypothetical protein
MLASLLQGAVQRLVKPSRVLHWVPHKVSIVKQMEYKVVFWCECIEDHHESHVLAIVRHSLLTCTDGGSSIVGVVRPGQRSEKPPWGAVAYSLA